MMEEISITSFEGVRIGQTEDAGRKLESTFRVVALTFANFADTLQVIAGLLQVVLGAITPGQSAWVGEGFGRIGNGLGFGFGPGCRNSQRSMRGAFPPYDHVCLLLKHHIIAKNRRQRHLGLKTQGTQQNHKQEQAFHFT